MKLQADLIFFNGSVITADANNSLAEAVALKGNTIIYCGTMKGVYDFVGENTREIDLNGNTLMPGFIDSHIHFTLLGLKQGPIIDITVEKADSIKAIQSIIKESVKTKKPGQWIVLSGYDHNKLIERRHPSKEDLDQVAPDNPVRCTRCCAHMGVYNSRALEIAGIKDSSAFGQGEVVEKDGQLTGLLKENAHMYMGSLAEFSDQELKDSLKAAEHIMHKNGITSLCDAGSDGIGALDFIYKGIKSKDLKVRIKPMIFDLAGKQENIDAIDWYLDKGKDLYQTSNRFAVASVKIMIDGSSSGPSSATRKPYSHDPDLKGILTWNQEEIDDIVEKVHKAGLSMTAHAVGDMAVEMIVNSIEKSQEANPRVDARHRIEHCGLVDEELLIRIKNLGIIPIANPGFIERNGKDYNTYYGDRVNYMFPLKSFLAMDIPCAIGSDAPVVSENPMKGLYGAINRRDGISGEAVGENQKIHLLEAIKMYTYNGAYATFDEDIKGSIEVGKLADLVVLSKNLLDKSLGDIRDVHVTMTIMDGEIVYQKQ